MEAQGQVAELGEDLLDAHLVAARHLEAHLAVGAPGQVELPGQAEAHRRAEGEAQARRGEHQGVLVRRRPLARHGRRERRPCRPERRGDRAREGQPDRVARVQAVSGDGMDDRERPAPGGKPADQRGGRGLLPLAGRGGDRHGPGRRGVRKGDRALLLGAGRGARARPWTPRARCAPAGRRPPSAARPARRVSQRSLTRARRRRSVVVRCAVSPTSHPDRGRAAHGDVDAHPLPAGHRPARPQAVAAHLEARHGAVGPDRLRGGDARPGGQVDAGEGARRRRAGPPATTPASSRPRRCPASTTTPPTISAGVRQRLHRPAGGAGGTGVERAPCSGPAVVVTRGMVDPAPGET